MATAASNIDLQALMKALAQNPSQTTLATTAPVQAAKPRRKAPTVDEKLEKAILAVLRGADSLGLHYTELVLKLDEDELNQKVVEVKLKNNLQ